MGSFVISGDFCYWNNKKITKTEAIFRKYFCSNQKNKRNFELLDIFRQFWEFCKNLCLLWNSSFQFHISKIRAETDLLVHFWKSMSQKSHFWLWKSPLIAEFPKCPDLTYDYNDDEYYESIIDLNLKSNKILSQLISEKESVLGSKFEHTANVIKGFLTFPGELCLQALNRRRIFLWNIFLGWD